MDDQDYENRPRQWHVAAGQTKTIELDDVEALDVQLVHGRVDVIGTDDDVTRLEITKVKGEPLDIDYSSHTLTITHPKQNYTLNTGLVRGLRSLFNLNSTLEERFGVEVSLLVPRRIRVAVSMVHGDTLVSGLTQGAKLETVSGTVISDGLTGRLKLDNVSGKVEARNHHGDIRADNVSGEVVLSGDIGQVKVDSVSGNVYIDAFGAPQQVTCEAVSGNMAIRLDPEVRVHYHMTTMSGKALIDGQRFKTGMKGFEYDEGPESGPLTSIRFSAISGSLKSVRRADDPPHDQEFPNESFDQAVAPDSGESRGDTQ